MAKMPPSRLSALRSSSHPISAHSHHIPSSAPSRPQHRSLSSTPCLGADLIRRPHRPYQFTALVQHSDGSMSFTRTTSPQPLWKAVKDIRNHVLWNPSNKRIANVEEDEAGKLSAFRQRFGRGFDAEVKADDEDVDAKATAAAAAETGAEVKPRKEVEEKKRSSGMDSLMDLISPGYSDEQSVPVEAVRSTKKGQGKKGKR